MIKMKEIYLSFEDFDEEMEELGGSEIIKISEPEEGTVRVYYDSTWLEQRELSNKNKEEYVQTEMLRHKNKEELHRFLFIAILCMIIFYCLLIFVFA